KLAALEHQRGRLPRARARLHRHALIPSLDDLTLLRREPQFAHGAPSSSPSSISLRNPQKSLTEQLEHSFSRGWIRGRAVKMPETYCAPCSWIASLKRPQTSSRGKESRLFDRAVVSVSFPGSFPLCDLKYTPFVRVPFRSSWMN